MVKVLMYDTDCLLVGSLEMVCAVHIVRVMSGMFLYCVNIAADMPVYWGSACVLELC